MAKELSAKYGHKILVVSELLDALGQRPRKSSVVMCHGCFDVVHPGHLRHLAYASSKADVLVVSITEDRFIKKGVGRPHVPQDLRALNLAALDMVDYVVIDERESPIDLIRNVQPEFFAKGFEYSSSGLPPATEEEKQTLSEYGGNLIFTPGDVVYSSTKLIADSAPSIEIDRLLALMLREEVTFSLLKKTVSSLGCLSFHVIGDVIVDSFTRTRLIGGQTKTPTFSVQYERREDFVGGAGVVAKHLKSSGASVKYTTVLGDDELAQFVIADLESQGIEVNAVLESGRPTTHKNAIVASGYRLLKIDTLDNRTINESTLEAFINSIQATHCDCIVFSDFRHGIFNSRTVPVLIESIPPSVFKVADSQVATRWGNITEFKNFDLITPNEREARFALADQDSTVGSLTRNLCSIANPKNLILKLGDKGSFSCSVGDHGDIEQYFTVSSFTSNVVDAVGAGDAFLAYATCALRTTGSLIQASILGAIAAACACEIDGNEPITVTQILDKISQLEKLSEHSS